MATVAVTGVAKDETGRRDSRAWTVFSQSYRSGDTGEVITTKPQTVQVVAGVFTANLESGPAVLVNPDGKRYFVTIPDAAVSLDELVAAAEGVPPDTSSDLLAAAVDAFVTNNPGYPWTGLGSRPAPLVAGANQPNGYPVLGSDAKLDPAQMPDLSIVDYLGSAANQSAMLAFSGQKGDWCTRSDTGTGWIITGSNPASLASWTQLPYPSVTKATLGLGSVDNTADTAKPVSTPQAAADTATLTTATGRAIAFSIALG